MTKLGEDELDSFLSDACGHHSLAKRLHDQVVDTLERRTLQIDALGHDLIHALEPRVPDLGQRRNATIREHGRFLALTIGLDPLTLQGSTLDRDGLDGFV